MTTIVAILGVVAIAVVVIAGGSNKPQHDERRETAGTVEIEVRSKPRAHVYYNRVDVGLSPVTLHVPKSDVPIDLAMSLKGRSLLKHVVPDHPQTIDFFVP